MECFFPLLMCGFVGINSLFEFDFSIFIGSSSDVFNIIVTMLFCGLLMYLPYVWLKGILNNFKELQSRRVKSIYGFLYENNKTDCKINAVYNIIFITRRFLTVIVIVFLREFSYFQLLILIIFSLLNLIYLVVMKPMLTKSENKIEIIDEICIYLIVITMSVLLNIAISEELKNLLGWVLINIMILNIVGNLI